MVDHNSCSDGESGSEKNGIMWWIVRDYGRIIKIQIRIGSPEDKGKI